MSLNKWVYRVSDGQFCFGDGPNPIVYLSDSVNYGLADVGDDKPMPDVRTQKWSGSAVAAKSAQEITDFDAACRSERHQATSRQKDVLATCALIVRQSNVAAWNAMTTPQKVTATLAAADVWKAIRDFVENNVP